MKAVEEALKGDDKADIEAKTEAMMTASHKLSEKMYAEAGLDAASIVATACRALGLRDENAASSAAIA